MRRLETVISQYLIYHCVLLLADAGGLLGPFFHLRCLSHVKGEFHGIYEDSNHWLRIKGYFTDDKRIFQILKWINANSLNFALRELGFGHTGAELRYFPKRLAV